MSTAAHRRRLANALERLLLEYRDDLARAEAATHVEGRQTEAIVVPVLFAEITEGGATFMGIPLIVGDVLKPTLLVSSVAELHTAPAEAVITRPTGGNEPGRLFTHDGEMGADLTCRWCTGDLLVTGGAVVCPRCDQGEWSE
jgi:hypothetical protein